MSLSNYLATVAETKENHLDKHYKTRYYRAKYTKIKESLELYAKEQGFTITKVSDKFGEIFLQKNDQHIIATVIQVNPLETGIDLKVQVYKLIGRNKPYKEIINLYNYLDKNHQFKGVGLHP